MQLYSQWREPYKLVSVIKSAFDIFWKVNSPRPYEEVYGFASFRTFLLLFEVGSDKTGQEKSGMWNILFENGNYLQKHSFGEARALLHYLLAHVLSKLEDCIFN